MGFSKAEIAKTIDHTILKPGTGASEVVRLCAEAREHGFFAVCVQPCYVDLCVKELENSGVSVATVIGFPQGANLNEVKAFEAKLALESGADELDMVINIGALKDGLTDLVYEDIKGIVETAATYPEKIVKVIIETALLNREEIVTACQLAEKAGAHFVKTSTGFAGGGAALSDIELMAASVSKNVKIKASGGIKTREQALNFLKAGAHRLGTSSGIAIIQDA